ncbi:MAG TPA: OmpA family protein [Gemmatimonadaceae bacterium]|nr:OmpA family protein [Gemmatimonadaceae bacterium]
MRIPRTALAMLAALALPATASAQITFGFDIGGFGAFTVFDQTLGLDDDFGGGGRVGLLFGSGLATFQVEGEMSYVNAKAGPLAVKNIPVRARLLYRPELKKGGSLLLGVGGVRNEYDPGETGGGDVAHELGATGLIGFETMLARHLAMRVEAVVDYIPKDWNESVTSYRTISTAQVGFSIPFRFGAPPPPAAKPAAPAPVVIASTEEPDADGDKVPNLRDRCPGTPAGTPVDEDGCTLYRDADGDGVVNERDLCPMTPAGDKVDGTGCTPAKDADLDGIGDAADRCPGTPAGDKVDAAGCTLARDADADGVSDAADRCPGTPAGEKVDAAGCTLTNDTDADGVGDLADRCPNTPPRVSVDSSGCPRLFTATTKTVTLRGVNFAPARATLTAGSLAILDDVARQLNEVPTIRIEIAGHTDNRGTAVRNLRLSRARAETVREYLIAQGVAPSRLVAKGYGPYSPVTSNTTPAGRARNRRVELKKLD